MCPLPSSAEPIITVLPRPHGRSRITWDDPSGARLARRCATALGEVGRGDGWIEVAAPQAETAGRLARAVGTRTPRPGAPTVPITTARDAPGWTIVTAIGGSGRALPLPLVLLALPMSTWVGPEVGAWAGDVAEAAARLLDVGCTPDQLPELPDAVGAGMGVLLGEARPQPAAWHIRVRR